MNSDEREQFAERWLEEALARYSDAEPRPGLESRILANLEAASESAPHRWSWRMAWIPVACAAMVTVAISIGVLRSSLHLEPVANRTRPAAANVAASQHPESTGTPTRATVLVRPHPDREGRFRARLAIPNSNPRRTQFPSPAPESQEERLLALYVATAPGNELVTVLDSQRQRREEMERRQTESGRPDSIFPTERNEIRPSVNLPQSSDPGTTWGAQRRIHEINR